MNGPKKTYDEYLKSLETIQEPIVPRAKIDMRGALQYARAIGVSVENLSKKEKDKFIQYV